MHALRPGGGLAAFVYGAMTSKSLHPATGWSGYRRCPGGGTRPNRRTSGTPTRSRTPPGTPIRPNAGNSLHLGPGAVHFVGEAVEMGYELVAVVTDVREERRLAEGAGVATVPPTKTAPAPPLARRFRNAIDWPLGRPSSVGRMTAIGPRMMRFLSVNLFIVSGRPRTSAASDPIVATTVSLDSRGVVGPISSLDQSPARVCGTRSNLLHGGVRRWNSGESRIRHDPLGCI